MSKVNKDKVVAVDVSEAVSESRAVVVKGIKADFDLKAFKASGRVVATFQISAGNDVRYRFKAAGATFDEGSQSLIFPEGFTSESFTDCYVYIPSLRDESTIDSSTVFHEMMAQVAYDYFRTKHSAYIKEMKENGDRNQNLESGGDGATKHHSGAQEQE